MEIVPDPFLIPIHQQGYLTQARSTTTAFSPDGRSLALAQGNVALWEIAGQTPRSALETPAGSRIASLVYSPNGARLAAVSEAGDVWVWDAHSGDQQYFFSQAYLLEAQRNYMTVNGLTIATQTAGLDEHGIAFSPDSNLLAFGNGPLIQIIDFRPERYSHALALPQHPGQVTQICFSADGKRIYAVLDNGQSAAIWDTASGQLLREVKLAEVSPQVYSSTALNGPLLARNNSDDQENKWIEVWNLDSGQMARTDIPGWSVEPLRFSPDGRLLVGYALSQLYFWNAQTGICSTKPGTIQSWNAPTTWPSARTIKHWR
jgi:WD40 repeat protein